MRATAVTILVAVLLALFLPGAWAQVTPPPMVKAPAPGAGAFGSGLSGPAVAQGPAPQFRPPPPLPSTQNLDPYGTPFTTIDPSRGLPSTPPIAPGALQR